MNKISIITPVYNSEKYIEKMIDSIMNQTLEDFELILIDDCGNDDTIRIIKEKYKDERIHLVHNDCNMGISYSRNRGIEMASGEYIALMDDDDIAPSDRLEKEYHYLLDHPDIDAVGGRYSVIDEDDNITGWSEDTLQNPKYVRACLMFYDPLGNGTMLFKKNTVIKNGIRFKNHCCGMEDYLFWIDFSKVASISNIKEVMLCWRNINGNETSRFTADRKKQRVEKFAEIQKYAIRRNGIVLSKEDENFLTSMLPEGRFDQIVSKGEMERLYKILKEMVCQAKEKGFDNYLEIRTACRKQFSRRLEYSEIWDL